MRTYVIIANGVLAIGIGTSLSGADKPSAIQSVAGAGRAVGAALRQGAAERWSPAVKNGKWGFRDASGNFVVEPKFDLTSRFAEGLAAVQVENQFGYIDPGARFHIQPQFEVASRFAGGLAGVQLKGGRCGFIDHSGKLIIPAEYEAVGSFAEGLAPVRIGHKYGYIDRTGKLVIKPQFELAQPFSSGVAAVKVQGKYGYVDRTGKLAIRPQFHAAAPFAEGLAAVKVKPSGSKGGYGFIDLSGQLKIQPTFSFVGPFCEGLAGVRTGDKFGYIDTEGGYMIPAKYDATGPFSMGTAHVVEGHSELMISANGEQISTAADVQPVECQFVSNPGGADVYLIPLYEWSTSTNKDALLSTDWLLPSGKSTSPAEKPPRTYRCSLYVVYHVVFLLGSRRAEVKLDPTEGTHVEVTFQ